MTMMLFNPGLWRGALLAVAIIGGVSEVAAEPCGADRLGTTRVLSVDPAMTPRIGLKSFPQTLPLADREVVLTFDDGPWPDTTGRVLKALADECVRATFFLIGRNAASSPGLVRRIHNEGHTVGHHSYSHPILPRLSHKKALADIDRGIAADENALGLPREAAGARFFRFPGFASNAALLEAMASRNIAVFGADLWASDWVAMSPDQQLQLVTQRLMAVRRGIVLFHDTKQQTASMLPAFLRFLKESGFRVVHVVPRRTADRAINGTEPAIPLASRLESGALTPRQ